MPRPVKIPSGSPYPGHRLRPAQNVPFWCSIGHYSYTKIADHSGGSAHVLPGQPPSLNVTEVLGLAWDAVDRLVERAQAATVCNCVRSGQIPGTLVQVERAVRPSSPLLIRGFGPKPPHVHSWTGSAATAAEPCERICGPTDPGANRQGSRQQLVGLH
jgi:hypothetical protein